MTLSGRWAGRLAPKKDQPSPSSPISTSPWARIKSRISRLRRQEATDPEISRGTNVPTNNPCHQHTHREHTLLYQISSPRSLATTPRRPTTYSPSQDPPSLPPTENSSRSPLHDSPVSDLISKCDDACSPVPRAETIGVIGSTECHLPSSDAEANTDEVAKVVSLRHLPTVPSPDPIRFGPRSERSPTHEADLAWGLGSFDAMSVHQKVELSVCLRNGSMARAQRRRPRARTVRASRRPLEPASQDVSPEISAPGLTTSPKNAGPPVNGQRVESAAGEVTSSSAAAPVATTPLSGSRSYAWVIEAINSCTQPAAEASVGTQSHQYSTASSHSSHPRSQDSQESSSELPFDYDYILSAPPTADRTPAAVFGQAPSPSPGIQEAGNGGFRRLPNGLVDEFLPLARANGVDLTGSAVTGCRPIGREWVQSAGDNESRSSFPDAPLPPTAVLHFRPCNIVVVVTPPSPPVNIGPSESQKCLKNMGPNLDISRPALHHPQTQLANSTSQADNHSRAFRPPAIVTKSLPINYSWPFRPATDQGVGSAAYVRSSKRTVSKVVTNLVERTTDAQNAHAKNKALSTPRRFGPSGNSEDQLTFFDMLALGGSIDDAEQPVDGVWGTSAADQAEPSLCVEPIPRTLSRRSIQVKRSAEEHYQARALLSRVTSSVSKWAKAVSKLKLVHRPERPQGNAVVFGPHFDPWEEGYVPPRGPSPDGIAPDDALEPSKSGNWNVYVKLDE